MARRRFFVDCIRDGRAELAGDDGRHLSRVLRAEAGQQFEISDNRAVYLAEVREVRKDRVLFEAREPVELHPPPIEGVVYAALIKFDRFEWMVEKLTEIGAAAIVPFEAARSERGLAEAAQKRVERWRRIARESSQQARRDRLPDVPAPVRLEDVLRDPAAHRYFLDEAPGTEAMCAVLPRGRAGERVCLMAGPEGGWTEAERAMATAAGWRAVSLGPTVLRAETAALAAFSVMACTWCIAGSG